MLDTVEFVKILQKIDLWPMMIKICIDLIIIINCVHAGSLSCSWTSCDLDGYFVVPCECHEESAAMETQKAKTKRGLLLGAEESLHGLRGLG